MSAEKVTVADGKYTVINDNGKLSALRNGEPWGRDLLGDNLVYWMMVRIRELEELLLRAEDAIEALDGTNVENEKLVDDFRTFKEGVTP